MARIRYLSVLDVEALHAFIMERTGDSPSELRDRGLLEAAVIRPQMAAHYANPDLVAQAALLAVAISQTHAYIQGNKRTAFIAADVFLRLNGCLFVGDALEAARHLESVAAREGSEEEATGRFIDWLRLHVTCEGALPDREP